MKNSKIIYLYLLILISYACNDDPVESKSSVSSYFPIQIGNEWRFEFPYWTPWSGDTTAINNSKIIASKIVNGKKYYGFNNAMPFFPYHPFLQELIGANIDTIFVRQNEKGDIMLLVAGPEWLYLTFNTELQNSLVRTKIKDANYFFMVESFDDTVHTQIGSFYNCCRILNYFPEIKGTEHYIWFASGYGPVKIYYPELDVTYQLVKINILKN